MSSVDSSVGLDFRFLVDEVKKRKKLNTPKVPRTLSIHDSYPVVFSPRHQFIYCLRTVSIFKCEICQEKLYKCHLGHQGLWMCE